MAAVGVVSYPTRWSFSFILGPLHWSRGKRNIVQLCTRPRVDHQGLSKVKAGTFFQQLAFSSGAQFGRINCEALPPKKWISLKSDIVSGFLCLRKCSVLVTHIRPSWEIYSFFVTHADLDCKIIVAHTSICHVKKYLKLLRTHLKFSLGAIWVNDFFP